MNETLKRLYESHAPALILYARIWCHAPEDALQEAMVELANQPELPADPVAWLYQAVRFRSINLHRGEKRRNQREQEVATNRKPFFTSKPQQAVDAEALESALERLEDQSRAIVIARIWGGLTFEQIAQSNRLSSSSVHRQYHDAIKTLKETLDGIPCKGTGND